MLLDILTLVLGETEKENTVDIEPRLLEVNDWTEWVVWEQGPRTAKQTARVEDYQAKMKAYLDPFFPSRSVIPSSRQDQALRLEKL